MYYYVENLPYPDYINMTALQNYIYTSNIYTT